MSGARAFLSLFPLAACSLAGCGFGDEAQAVPAETGPVESRSFAATGFDEVVAATPDRVVIRRGDRFAISARGRAALLDRLDITTDGSTLRIRREGNFSGRDQDRLGTAVITITMPRLTDLTLAGSGEVSAEQLDGGNAALTLAGSGDMTIGNAIVTAIDITLAGSGDITLTGRADRAEVTVAGSGSVSGTTFGARDAEVNVAGSGDVTLTVRNRADVSVLGSGDVTISGGATCTTSRRGSGTVTCAR
jgi:hypothetical protein